MKQDKLEEFVKAPKLSEEEILQRNYDGEAKRLKIALARASRVRLQATQAYGVLEDIRLDYLDDSAFRDKLTLAKKYTEQFLHDFLLDDAYWRDKISEHRKRTPKEYDDFLTQAIKQN